MRYLYWENKWTLFLLYIYNRLFLIKVVITSLLMSSCMIDKLCIFKFWWGFFVFLILNFSLFFKCYFKKNIFLNVFSCLQMNRNEISNMSVLGGLTVTSVWRVMLMTCLVNQNLRAVSTRHVSTQQRPTLQRN